MTTPLPGEVTEGTVVVALEPPANRSDDPESVAAWLSDVADDPVAFVDGAFPWGEGELTNCRPEPWQQEILALIRDGLPLGQAIKIAVASGHGVGKTALICWVALWAIATFPDCRGIITAATEPMLLTRVRAELRKWLRLFRARPFFELGATALTSRDAAHEQTWRLDLLAWSEMRPEAFAGLHNQGKRILVIYDECSAIADIIWETTEGALTDADTQILWLAFGNPLRPTGRFRRCFERDSWVTKRVNSQTVSLTNKDQIKQWIDSWGIDSDFIRTRVLGEFPRTASTQFIGPDLVDEAMRRVLEPSTMRDPLVIGVDVARFGDDSSVIYARKGMDARSILPLEYKNIPLDKLEDRVIEFCNAHRVSMVFVDGTGVGGGVVDHLRRRGLTVYDVQFAGKADQGLDGVKYANKRCEIWGLLRNALQYLCLPNNGELRQQLVGPEYGFNVRGEIQLERKEDMKKRGLASPDLADALAMTFAAEMATLPVSQQWGRGDHLVVSEYDPFSDEVMRGEPPQPSRSPRYYVEGYPRLRDDD
jgi:hypothetical protein